MRESAARVCREKSDSTVSREEAVARKWRRFIRTLLYRMLGVGLTAAGGKLCA